MTTEEQLEAVYDRIVREQGEPVPEKFNDFYVFHSRHPEVYPALVESVRELGRHGFRHYSIAGCFEVVRFNKAIQTGEEFKLTNTLKPYYARMIMELNPSYEGFFDTNILT